MSLPFLNTAPGRSERRGSHRAADLGGGALRPRQLPLPDCVGQVGHPLRRLRTDRLQGHAGRVERGLDAVVNEVEGGPARPLPGVTLLVRHDEDRRVERRLLRPRLLAEVEHALAHDARAGALERLPHDLVVAPLLAALAELQVLPEEPLREDPLLQFHPLRHPALHVRVVPTLLGRDEALHGLGRDEPVQRHRHAEEHLPGHQPSAPFRTISVTWAASLLRVCWPPSIAWYFSTAASRSSLVGNAARISIRVAAPSGANVRTDSKAFGSPRDSPWSSAIRSGGAMISELTDCSPPAYPSRSRQAGASITQRVTRMNPAASVPFIQSCMLVCFRP